MSSRLKRRVLAGACVALAAVSLAQVGKPVNAGANSVDPVGPVFVPPSSFGQVAGVWGQGGQGGGTAAGGASGDALGEQALRLIETAQFVCGALPAIYVVSCLSERYEAAEKVLPNTAEFAEPKAALNKAWRGLEDVARENRDRDQRRVTVRTSGPNPIQTSRPLTPVAPARVDTAISQAEEILDEVETVLIRSAEASEERAALFTDMAEAVGSDKVLLRS